MNKKKFNLKNLENMKTIKDLEDVGFVNVGSWSSFANNQIDFIIKDDTRKEILYSFILMSNNEPEIIYIGKTIKTITDRLKGYRKPGRTQNTNIRLNKVLSELLQNDTNRINIFVFNSYEFVYFRNFKINLAAGLEDVLIREFRPKYNLHGNSKIIEELETDEKHIVVNVVKMEEEFCHLGIKYASKSNLLGNINFGFIPQNFLPEIGDVVTIHLGQIEFNANFINANPHGNTAEPRVNSVLIGRWLVEHNINVGDTFYVKVCNNNTFHFYINAQ